jgi:hypothetical protein
MIDKKTGQYEAAQIKLYRFYLPGEREVDHIFIGEVEVLWTLQGNIASEKRTAKLSFRNFQLDHRWDIDIRIKIMKGLGLIAI